MPPLAPSDQTPNVAESDLFPLNEFYAQAGHPLPALEKVAAEQLPEPYRELLAHDNDMTSTLERFHGEKVHLEIFRRQRIEDIYYREVILVLDDSGTAVEFGAIRIDLALFEAIPQQLILEGKLPLGRILQDCNLVFASRPRAFLKLASDPFMNTVLKLTGTLELYGRRNSLIDGKERTMAEIVEILPPTPPRQIPPGT